jgi:hypothetical protein
MHAFSENMELQEERQKLKNLHGKKKLEYIWDYYKLPIGLILLALVMVIYGVYGHFHSKEQLFSVTCVNLDLTEELQTQISDDFIHDFLGLDTGSYNLLFDTNTYLTDEEQATDAQAAYAGQMKVMATFAAEQMDILFLNDYAFDTMAPNGYLMDLEEFLSAEDPELYETVKSDLENNILIVEDNTDDILLDSSIEYEAVTEEHPFALSLSGSDFFSESSVDIHLGIASNTTHRELVIQYLRYLYGLDCNGFSLDAEE